MRNKFEQNRIKLFGMTNQILELDLAKIEAKYDIDLGRSKKKKKDNIYYPQFDLEIRKEAKKMAKNYEIFYCLERSIRSLINSIMTSALKDENWWEKRGVVPAAIIVEVKKRIKNEIDAGATIRPNDSIDFTTFGELNEIIKLNWLHFEEIFKSQKAVQGVMNKLNTLRGPIAHCTKLAEDEEVRLQLSVRDWYRLME